MDKNIKPVKKNDHPAHEKTPEIVPPIDPEEPFRPEEDPDEIPEEDSFTLPPYEIPIPGEGP